MGKKRQKKFGEMGCSIGVRCNINNSSSNTDTKKTLNQLQSITTLKKKKKKNSILCRKEQK